MDPGVPDGSWLNFLFQDDAAHYLNFSSNVVHHVHGGGQQESGMIKSVGSVFENNGAHLAILVPQRPIVSLHASHHCYCVTCAPLADVQFSGLLPATVVADAVLGHVFNICPYLEPAANMIYAHNIHANVTASHGTKLDISTAAYTFATLAGSGKLAPFAAYSFERGPPAGWPPLELSDPVLRQFDHNTYFGVQGFDIAAMQAHGFDASASEADPQLARSAEARMHPWNSTCSDYVPAPGSPVHAAGFRPLDMSGVGLDARFEWDRATILRVDASAGKKIQAERYQRMHGLWRQGSFCISGGLGASGFDFARDAWARYDNVDIDCAAPCTFSVRYKTDAVAADKGVRTVALALDAPATDHAVATIAGAESAQWTTLNVTATGSIHRKSATVFLLLDGVCDIDWFSLCGQ